MGIDVAHEFANHLRSKNHLAGEVSLRDGTAAGNERTLQKLWELTELSANDFADEVAQFFKVPRVPLPDLLAAEPLVKQFSRRFLREMTVFPYRAADGKTVLAVADPSDTAAVRAAGIVLGDGINVAVASFEDITTVLNQRLGEEDAAAATAADAAPHFADDDIESLRDLACGAPVVRAVSDLFEKLSNCARAISISSRSGRA